jgi:phospholipid/cholesterol/gamma-HCH transport system ATP-binding protein
MFGPREVLLTSEDPVVTQFVNGQRHGPIGMSEERDAVLAGRGAATMMPGPAAYGSWRNDAGAGGNLPDTGTGAVLRRIRAGAGTPGDGTGGNSLGLRPQLEPSPGLPPRSAVQRRKDRVMSMLYTLPPAAQEAILGSLTLADRARYNASTAGPGQPTEPVTRPLLPRRHRTPPGPAPSAPGGSPQATPGGGAAEPPWAPPTQRPGPRDDPQEPQRHGGPQDPAAEGAEGEPQGRAAEDGPQDPAGEDGQ